ncbi:MAG: hypothetical protein JWQ95_6050 [Sphaerisporangium sp.]|nr:hypothetical protein [Sphaerisporangium sp.]
MIRGLRFNLERCWMGVDVSGCLPLLQYSLQYATAESLYCPKENRS